MALETSANRRRLIHFSCALAMLILSASTFLAATRETLYEESDLPPVPPLPPSQFNPDPGAMIAPKTTEAALPELFLDIPLLPPDYGLEPLPEELDRRQTTARAVEPLKKLYEYREYPTGNSQSSYPAFAQPMENRWFAGFGKWKRYSDPTPETPYQEGDVRVFHPYLQSTLKGDAPIVGQDIFLSLTMKNFTLIEGRKLPVSSGVSAAEPNSSEFFGRGDQFLISNDISLTIELFKGETAFKPVEWAIRLTPVFNINRLVVEENGLVDPDPRGPDFPENNSSTNNREIVNPGDGVIVLEEGGLSNKPKNLARRQSRYVTRTKDYFAFQEAFTEIHLRDLSNSYDFFATRIGNQQFVSDFRGFIFNDTNLGWRVFGNADNNRMQYNLVWFNMREKDTYSDLNTFDSRHQNVIIANVYRQDFIWPGYTAQLSLHANFDEGQRHYDQNDFIVRPAPIGDVRDHDVRAYYLGWAGDGHIGRWNISHAFYQVFGRDEYNGIAGQPVDINAQMAALEISYDRDWVRYKFSLFYGSGDSDAQDGNATGFDSILDNPFFFNGPFSYFVHQGINLAGTAVNLKQRDSLLNNLRTSKTEGQANFVNPGTFIVGVGADFDLTPRLRAFTNINYIWMTETDVVETVLLTNKSSNDFGLDASIGFQWRPLLTDNIIVSAGVGIFIPGNGYKDIYRTNSSSVPGFTPSNQNGEVDDALYNGFLTVTLTY